MRRLAEAGGHLAEPKVHRRLVRFHDVPVGTTPEQMKEYIDRELEGAGLEKLGKEEVSFNPKGWLKQYYRPRWNGAQNGENRMKGYMWVADRVRWALHHKCNDRVRRGHEFQRMRVEDAGGPGMCFRCCSYGHRADQCTAGKEDPRGGLPHGRARCAYCSGEHEMNECEVDKEDSSQLRCGACGVQGHHAHEIRRCKVGRQAWTRWQADMASFLDGPSPQPLW